MWEPSQKKGEGSRQQNQLCRGEVLPPYLEESELVFTERFTGGKSKISWEVTEYR